MPAHSTGTGTPGPRAGRALLAGLERLVGALSYLGAVLGVAVVLSMVAVVAYSVFNRYVLNTPVTWSDELSGYLVVALVMVGAAEALRRNDHIGVDLLTVRLPERARRWTEIWGMAAVCVVAVALLRSSAEMLAYSHDFEVVSEGYLEVPMWIPQGFLVPGAGLLLLAAANRILRLALGLDRPAAGHIPVDD